MSNAPRPCVPAASTPVRRVEVELPDRDDREARAERPPVGAAVVGHERADVGADVERVRERRVEDDAS